MAKRCSEDFNPWPPFVDIFSSTILVLLLFMLILIVNIAYYAQFKFKVSYVDTVASVDLVTVTIPRDSLKETLKKNRAADITEDVETPENSKKKEIEKVKTPENSKEIELNNDNKGIINTIKEKEQLETAGRDFVRLNNKTTTLQTIIEKEDMMVVNFANKEIIVDDPVIIKIKDFIAKMKEKFPKHKVIVSSSVPTNQLSATVAKQIALARTLNIRNLIRKLRYKKSDVRIKLTGDSFKNILPQNKSGYVIIYAKVNK